MTAVEQRQAAKEFAEFWNGKEGYEKGESQSFWLSLLRDVLGVEHPEQIIEFEKPVKKEHTAFMDAYIPSTRVLIEQKSRNVNLDAPIRQSNGSLASPFQQALNYIPTMAVSEHPRWVITCNFEQIRFYDMERPNDPPEVMHLLDLADEYERLFFLIDPGSDHIRREIDMSVKAGEIVARIHDALSQEYVDITRPESSHSLNVLCVRLVFCLYADSSGLFGRQNMFGEYLKKNEYDVREALLRLFRVLDQEESRRHPYLSDDLAEFPYVNGGLFHMEIEIPKLPSEVVNAILYEASGNFKWRDISPTIFGAIFESTLNPDTRRSGGMHYTSVDNIHKVIDPLFLDGLRQELRSAQALRQPASREKRLEKFRDKLASLRFLDPACGSGNFLTETYLSLRRLENEAIRTLSADIQIQMDATNPVRVSIEQFYGIEINDFAATVAQAALWISEAQMLRETQSIWLGHIDYLPLKTSAHIRVGNALQEDWNEVLPIDQCSYVFGNPPFISARDRDDDQRRDVNALLGSAHKRTDYVAGWFIKASQYIHSSPDVRAAFVATNSITEGLQAAEVWPKCIFPMGIEIDFAWETFEWESESATQAAVHCVIIGFGKGKPPRQRRLFSEDGARTVQHIDQYLSDNVPLLVHSEPVPVQPGRPNLPRGCQPTDNGNLIMTEQEKDALLSMEPQAADFVQPYVMGHDLISGRNRYCLNLEGADPAVLSKCPEVLRRVKKVREFRANSNNPRTKYMANFPTLFLNRKHIERPYLAIPKVSSENYTYVPMAFLESGIIAGDTVFILEGADLFDFGVLISKAHMSWMRATSGRLKSDHRYDNTLSYNTFPWPSASAKQKENIIRTANAILRARNLYPTTSLSNLYNNVRMPPELLKAHEENDKAVLKAYGFRKSPHDITEPDIIERLMQMYADLTRDETAGQ